VLGSVSMPIGSSDDSMVKVASETVAAPQFYERYFALVEGYLPKPKKVKKADTPAEPPKVEQASADLGLPEPAPTSLAPAQPDAAPLAASAPVAVPAAAQASAPAAPDRPPPCPFTKRQQHRWWMTATVRNRLHRPSRRPRSRSSNSLRRAKRHQLRRELSLTSRRPATFTVHGAVMVPSSARLGWRWNP
jgi:hypothetical protein